MKLILLVILATVATGEVTKPFHLETQTVVKLMEHLQGLRNRTGVSVIINDVVDEIFKQASKYILENNLDPTQMPDLHLNFTQKLQLTTYHGDITLTKGKLYQLSTLRRGGDATASERNGHGIIQIPIAFVTFTMDHLFSAKLINLDLEGSAFGRIEDVTAIAEFDFHLLSLKATLTDFHLEARDLKLEFHGNALTDLLAKLFINLTSKFLYDQFLRIANDIVGDTARKIVDELNRIIGNTFEV